MLVLFKNSQIRRSICIKSTYFFSNSINEQIQRNKAILSSKIIDMICKSPLNWYRSNRRQPSLRQRILQEIDSYQIDRIDQPQGDKITSAVRYSLRRYFEDGVWVPKDMCSQKRFEQIPNIIYGKLKSLKKEVEIFVTQENEKDYQGDQFCKLQFCPTHIVTGQIFRHIIRGSPFLLLKGHYGVGKTYSFILYTLLSEIVFRYKHKYCSDQKMHDQKLKYFNDIPKTLYLCVKKNHIHHHEPAFINKLIKRQFYELKDTKYSGDIFNTKVFQGIYTLMLKHYGIRTVFIVNQINEIAEILRYELKQKKEIILKMLEILQNKDIPQDSNEKQNIRRTFKYQKIPQIREEVQMLNQKQDLGVLYSFEVPQKYESQQLKQNKQFMSKYSSYHEIIRQMIDGHFGSFIYVSSVQIEQYFLKKLQLTGASTQDSILSKIKRIFYPINYNGDILMADIAQFITFHLRNRWKAQLQRQLQQTQESLITKIKSQILNNLSKQEFRFFLPIKIKQAVQTQREWSFQILTKQYIVEQQFRNHVFYLMLKLQKRSNQDNKKKLLNFLKQDQGTPQQKNFKLMIVGQIWGQSKMIQKQSFQEYSQIDHQYSQEKAKKIQINFPEILIKISTFDYPKQKIKNFFPQNLLRINEYNELQCFINPKVILQVIASQKKNIYQRLLKCDQKTFRRVFNNLNSRGSFLQSILVEILQKGDVKFQIQYSLNQKSNIKLLNMVPKARGFIPIPIQNSKYIQNFKFFESFLENLQHILVQQKPKDQEKFCFFLFPAKSQWHQKLTQIPEEKKQNQKDQKQWFSFNSKLIDFAICKFTKYQDYVKLEINIFGLTIEKPSDLIKKIRGFFREMVLNFHDKYDSIELKGEQCRISINYIVITTSNLNKFNCKKYLRQQGLTLENKIQKEDQKKQSENTQLKNKQLENRKISNDKSKTQNIKKKITRKMPKSVQKKNQIQEIQVGNKRISLEDCGNLCKINMNLKYKSGKEVINTISVINLFDHTQLQCLNQSTVITELKLLNRLKLAYKKKLILKSLFFRTKGLILCCIYLFNVIFFLYTEILFI